MICHPQLHLVRKGLFSTLYDCLSNFTPIMTGLKLSVDNGDTKLSFMELVQFVIICTTAPDHSRYAEALITTVLPLLPVPHKGSLRQPVPEGPF